MWLILKPVLGILKAIPWWAYAIALALAWGGWQRHRATSAAKVYQAAQIEAAKLTEQALIENVRETARRLAAQQKATQDAEAQTLKARTAAASAAGAADRLRQRLVAIRAASAPAGDTAAAGAGTTDRLAEVFGKCIERLRSVAASADRAVIAGQTCATHYEALTK